MAIAIAQEWDFSESLRQNIADAARENVLMGRTSMGAEQA